MAKQLLGKEVTAALNEKIKANVAELQGKGENLTSGRCFPGRTSCNNRQSKQR